MGSPRELIVEALVEGDSLESTMRKAGQSRREER